MITFGNKLNRKYSLYFPFMDTNGIVDIYFHKKNSFLGINLSSRFYEYLKDFNMSYYVFRDLNKSFFCKKFLNLKNITSPHMDVIDSFEGIKREYLGKIQFMANEKSVLFEKEIKNVKYESNLKIYVLTIDNYIDEFVFVLAERNHVDISTCNQISRSCAIQISSKKCLKDVVNSDMESIQKEISIDDLRI